MAKVASLRELPEVKILEDITRETATRVIEHLSQYKGRPVALSIFSNGGDVHASNAIATYIANPANGLDVEARVYGNAFSGAMIIAASCKAAYISEGSFGLIHKAFAADENGEKVPDEQLSKDQRATLDAMNAAQIDLFTRKTGKTSDQVEKLMDQDKPLPARKAADFGLFDGIIPQAMALAAFKNQDMSEQKKTRTLKVSAGDALKAIASGVIEVPETEFTISEADKIKTLDEQIVALTKERDEIKAKSDGTEKEKAEALEAKTKSETELVAMTKERDEAKAVLAKLATMPLVAQVLSNGAEAVIPGAPVEQKKEDLSPRAQHAAQARSLWEERKNELWGQPAQA